MRLSETVGKATRKGLWPCRDARALSRVLRELGLRAGKLGIGRALSSRARSTEERAAGRDCAQQRQVIRPARGLTGGEGAGGGGRRGSLRRGAATLPGAHADVAEFAGPDTVVS